VPKACLPNTRVNWPYASSRRTAFATGRCLSSAMHLLQSGVSLEIIRDVLGHVGVKTTQIYARANLEMKRRALEKVAAESPSAALPSWQQSKSLLDWLRSL
jgi:integrase/recombinase XerD